MGQMRFLVPSAAQLPTDAVQRAYLAGIEGIPWRSRNSWAPDQPLGIPEFVVERSISDSGNLYLPWTTSGFGELCLCTASLMERAEPYLLPLELARGTLNRLRNQSADWQLMGLVLPEEFSAELRKISQTFSRAVTCGANFDDAAKLSAETIDQSVAAIDWLVAIFWEQATAARQSNNATLPTFLSVRVEHDTQQEEVFAPLAAAFNSCMVTMNWAEIEQTPGTYHWDSVDSRLNMSQRARLRIIGGPLLQLDRAHTPQWLLDSEADYGQVHAHLVRFVRAAVEHCRGKVHVWNCAARMNLESVIPMDEEQRLRLVVAVIDEVQRLDGRTPYIISFEKPWAEYLVTADHDFSPLHFADSLVRAELGLAGIGLEMNFGYWPHGSENRDLLEVSRLLDRWNMLGLPLLVFQSLPSSGEPDPLAQTPVAESLTNSGLTPDLQCKAAEKMLRLILAKSFVHGYVWQDVADNVPHEFGHGGVFDRQGNPKKIVQMFSDLRQQFLT